jgi:hypothetical protein
MVPMAETVSLAAVDGVEVTVVVDNLIDIIAASTDQARRPPWRWDWTEGDQLRAEHGYSLAEKLRTSDPGGRIWFEVRRPLKSVVRRPSSVVSM